MKKNLPILLALVALVVLGLVRYEHFGSAYNINSFWRYNSMFALISVGMAFVIITGGIDLSVGTVAAMSSIVAALTSTYGGWVAVLAGCAAGLAVGVLNGIIITRLKILPFITTLATSLGAHGVALLLGKNDAVSIDAASNFGNFGQGDLFGLPIPGIVAAVAALAGWLALRSTRFGRHSLAIGGSEEAARLMGLNVDRTLVTAYSGRTVRRRTAERRGRLGIVRDLRRGAGRHPADRRRRLDCDDDRRCAAARSGVQSAQLRKRPGLHQLIGVLAIGDSRRVPAGRHRDAGPRAEAAGPKTHGGCGGLREGFPPGSATRVGG
jgi:hypothetical protein